MIEHHLRRNLTDEEIEQGIEEGLWHWAGGSGGCGNQYLADGPDPGPWILLGFLVYAILTVYLIIRFPS